MMGRMKGSRLGMQPDKLGNMILASEKHALPIKAQNDNDVLRFSSHPENTGKTLSKIEAEVLNRSSRLWKRATAN